MTKGNKLHAHNADTAIILGSGLNSLVVDPKQDQIVPYSEFSEIPKPIVPGHVGRFVLGAIEKTKIIFAQGRVHLYEGHSACDVTSIVRAAGLSKEELSHQEVLEIGKKAAADFAKLLQAAVPS